MGLLIKSLNDYESATIILSKIDHLKCREQNPVFNLKG